MSKIIILASLLITGCVSSPRIEGINEAEIDVVKIIKTFESECSCGDKATLITTCVDDRGFVTEGDACYSIYVNGDLPGESMQNFEKNFCSVGVTKDGHWYGSRVAWMDEAWLKIMSGCRY